MQFLIVALFLILALDLTLAFESSTTEQVVEDNSEDASTNLRWGKKKKGKSSKSKKKHYQPSREHEMQAGVRVWADNGVEAQLLTKEEIDYVSAALVDSYNRAYHTEDPDADMHVNSAAIMTYGDDLIALQGAPAANNFAKKAEKDDEMVGWWWNVWDMGLEYHRIYYWYLFDFRCTMCLDDDDYTVKPRKYLTEGAEDGGVMLGQNPEPWEKIFCQQLRSSGLAGLRKAKNCKIAVDNLILESVASS